MRRMEAAAKRKWFIPEYIAPEKRNRSMSLEAFEKKFSAKGELWRMFRFADGTACRIFMFRDIAAPCGVCGQPSLSNIVLVGVDDEGLISGYWKKCDRCQALLDAKKQGRVYTPDELAVLGLREADVMPDDIGKRFDGFDWKAVDGGKNALDAAKAFSYREEFGEKKLTVMLLIGDVGVGKTHLAVASMYNFLLGNPGKTARYVRQTKLLDEIRQSYSERTTARILDTYSSYDILVIDEIGRMTLTANNVTVFQQILQERIERGRKTALCGNVKSGDLEDILGKQNVSRIKAVGRIAVLSGEDWREKYGVL